MSPPSGLDLGDDRLSHTHPNGDRRLGHAASLAGGDACGDEALAPDLSLQSRHVRGVDLGMSDLARIGGLPSADENGQIWRDIWYEEAHHSTAMEGNTLVLEQVQVLLDQGQPVGNKGLCEYLDVQGYANAARWVYGQAHAPEAWGRSGAISQAEIREIHRLAVGLVWEVCPPADPPLASDRDVDHSHRSEWPATVAKPIALRERPRGCPVQDPV